MSLYSALILGESGLQAYWRLGEASGAFSDSKNSHTGTGQGTVTYGETGALVGDSDKSLKFDGSSGAVGVTDHADLDLADGPFTLELWIKRTATQGTNQFLVYKGTNAYQLYFDTANRLSLKKIGAGTNIIRASAGSAITDTTTWHHLVATKDGVGSPSTPKLYIDGVDVGVIATNVALADTSTDFFIGGPSGGFYSGWIDEVAVYKSALSLARVKEHYQTGIRQWTDSGSGTISLSGSKTESKSVSDSASGTVSLSGTKTESLAFTDARSGTVSLSGTRSESAAYSDSRSGTLGLSGTASESLSHASSATGNLSLSGSVSESLSFADSRSGTVSLSGSSTEANAHVSATSGTLSLSGTKTESASHSATAAGTITLSGTSVEHWYPLVVYTDSRSGTITLSGTATEAYGQHIGPGHHSVTAPGHVTETTPGHRAAIAAGHRSKSSAGHRTLVPPGHID